MSNRKLMTALVKADVANRNYALADQERHLLAETYGVNDARTQDLTDLMAVADYERELALQDARSAVETVGDFVLRRSHERIAARAANA